MKIRQLPDTLANKIAAGEVVERPASVVKELIENSIDANSTNIQIDLKDAGLVQIKVTDNGDGMSSEDCRRAFLRHATSKIAYDSDLFHIQTLGFRGEALASIASVSKVTLKSSLGDEAGTKLYLEAGKVIDESKSDARKGTEITVEQLFYNTPARLKYLKSIHTELSHITDLVNRYALAHPDIRFKLTHNGKTIFSTTGSGNRLQVIAQIYGMQVARNMLFIKEETLDFHIEGYIAKPTHTRSNRNYMTMIVNGRYIKSHALTAAVIRAYDTLLPLHRYPIAVFSIQLDPILVDVNVHPTKLEVRFSKEKELIELIERLIRDKFKEETLIPEVSKRRFQREKTEQAEFLLEPKDVDAQDEIERKITQDENIFPERTPDHHLTLEETVREDVQQMDEETMEEQNIQVAPETNEYGEEEIKNDDRIPVLYPIGQLQGTYILAQNDLGLYMIDQHAAQERIKYEFYKKKLGSPSLDRQQLLFPLTFEFTTDEIVLIEKHIEDFEKVGLYLEPFGEKTYAVRSYPSWFPKGLEEDIIRDIVNQVLQYKKIDIEKLREEIAILMACKRSIKANQYLSLSEMERLLNDLRKTSDPFTCPHGRPVIIHFTYYEIEKMFKRIM